MAHAMQTPTAHGASRWSGLATPTGLAFCTETISAARHIYNGARLLGQRIYGGATLVAERVPGLSGSENRTVTGQVRSHWTGAAAIYTDGAAAAKKITSQWGRKGWLTGWGYLSTGGRYGCGPYPQLEGQAGRDLAVVAELRAVWNTIRDDELVAPVTIVLDSQYAFDVLERWKDGATEMPGDYLGSLVRTPTLEKLRLLVATRPTNLTVQHVKGHAGDPLNCGRDCGR